MGKNDMNHMQHLESVALSDCAVLQSKEATYQGSWKRAGGGSAWFMARRNLDRLITMMAPKEFPGHIQTVVNVRDTVDAIKRGKPLPGTLNATRDILDMLLDRYTSEDIFMKIRENPGGEDGTVLACMRDARRYFTLVEAEMIAEGVVEPEAETYEQENIVFQPETQEVHGTFEGKDVRLHVKNMDGTVTNYDFSHVLNPKVTVLENSIVIEVGMSQPPLPSPQSSGGYAKEQKERRIRELDPNFDAVLSDGVVHAEGQRKRAPTDEERAAMMSDGGSHHSLASALAPWQITDAEFRNLHARTGSTDGTLADLFYTRRANDVYQLEPVVKSKTCPREVYSAYELNGGCWVMRRDRVPSEIDDNFPKLQREMNTKEYEESPRDFQFMYYQNMSDGKWVLGAQFHKWGREPS